MSYYITTLVIINDVGENLMICIKLFHLNFFCKNYILKNLYLNIIIIIILYFFNYKKFYNENQPVERVVPLD